VSKDNLYVYCNLEDFEKSPRRADQEKNYGRKTTKLKPMISNITKQDTLTNNVNDMMTRLVGSGAASRTVNWGY